MRFWQIALAVWMGMYALLALTNVKFEQQNLLMGILAAIVCLFLIFERRPPATA